MKPSWAALLVSGAAPVGERFVAEFPPVVLKVCSGQLRSTLPLMYSHISDSKHDGVNVDAGDLETRAKEGEDAVGRVRTKVYQQKPTLFVLTQRGGG